MYFLLNFIFFAFFKNYVMVCYDFCACAKIFGDSRHVASQNAQKRKNRPFFEKYFCMKILKKKVVLKQSKTKCWKKG